MNTTRKQSILIVEDVTSDIDILNHILQNQYTILVAKTGEAALENAIRHRPDLILLDIILPDMTGFAVLSALKDSNETRDIPVIIITGIGNVQYEEKGLMLGAVDYITKPFHNTVVLARIRMHLRLIGCMRTLAKLGLVDSLTNLPNRTGFENRFGTEWARAVRERGTLSLLRIDVDGFAQYNARAGRPRGDQALQTIARSIDMLCRRPADLPARLENDDFVVLLPNTNLAGAVLMAEKIRSGVESMKFPVDDGIEDMMSITVSIGVTSFMPTTKDRLADFQKEAENGLSRAKDAGGNRVFHHDA